MSFGDIQQKGWDGGGGWVHLKGADSMAVSGLRLRNTLVGSERATAVLLCMIGLRKQSSYPAWCPFPVWASVCRLSAMTIASLLMGGSGLSHGCVEDGCMSTCVKFWD